jgi:hypothetical protein
LQFLGNFFSLPRLLARPNSKFAPLEESRTGKLLLFSAFRERLSDPRPGSPAVGGVIALLLPGRSRQRTVPVTILANGRLVRWLSASIGISRG